MAIEAGPVSQLKTQPNKPHFYDGQEDKGNPSMWQHFLADG